MAYYRKSIGLINGLVERKCYIEGDQLTVRETLAKRRKRAERVDQG